MGNGCTRSGGFGLPGCEMAPEFAPLRCADFVSGNSYESDSRANIDGCPCGCCPCGGGNGGGNGGGQNCPQRCRRICCWCCCGTPRC